MRKTPDSSQTQTNLMKLNGIAVSRFEDQILDQSSAEHLMGDEDESDNDSFKSDNSELKTM